jgi:hypothetical protein
MKHKCFHRICVVITIAIHASTRKLDVVKMNIAFRAGAGGLHSAEN